MSDHRDIPAASKAAATPIFRPNLRITVLDAHYKSSRPRFQTKRALPYRYRQLGKNRVRELARLHLSEETGGVFIRSPRAPSRGQAMRLDHGVRSARMSANKLSLVGVLIGTVIGGLVLFFLAISQLRSQDQQKTLPPPGQTL